MTTTILIITIVTGCYEVIARVVPTSKTWSIIGNIMKVLTYISNALDNGKKN